MYETIILHECRNSSILANVSSVEFFQHPVPFSHVQHNKMSGNQLWIWIFDKPTTPSFAAPVSSIEAMGTFLLWIPVQGKLDVKHYFFFEETKPAKYIQILLGLHCFGCLKLLI